MLMMLAFLVDQTMQLCDRLFQAVWAKMGSKRRLWEHVRAIFQYFQLTSMRQLYELLLIDYKATPPPRLLDGS